MNLKQYFDEYKGLGVLSTVNGDGQVNSAVYARPHFLDEETLVFIMRDRLTHKNLLSNPGACYLFKEEGNFEGKRLYLTMTKEEQNNELIEKLRRSKRNYHDKDERKFLVYFHIDNVLPLIGDGS